MAEKCAIICPIGETGNIVSMTINQWLDRLEEPRLHESNGTLQVCGYTEVVVIVPYTDVSNRTEENGLPLKTNIFDLFKEHTCLYEPDLVHYAHTYRWYPVLGYPALGEGRRLPEWPDCRITNLHLYMIPIHPQGAIDGIVDDIDDDSDNEQFQDLIYGLFSLLRERGYVIHTSLAGGRKTMSAYELMGAALLGAEQGVSHVLEPSKKLAREFYEKLEQAQIEALNLQIIHQESQRISEVQQRARESYQPPKGLFSPVPVSYIDLSPIIPYVLQQVSPATDMAIRQHVQALHKKSLQEIFQTSDDRQVLYTIGGLFRESLTIIAKGVSKKLQQG